MLHLTDYQIHGPIYESPSSFVYRGQRERDGQAVILKELKEDYPTPEERLRYRQEYELTHSLSLDGVITAYDLETYQHTLVIVFEDFGGQSLQLFLQDHSLSLKDVLTIAIQIANSLAQIHAANIIHKDLNPSNIVLNATTGQLKLIDFGIATQLLRENPTIKHPNVLEGTLVYMSPEQTGRMNRSLDYRTDLYSLGVTLYELLTGQLPFASDDALGLVHCHLAKMPVPPCELHPPVHLKGGVPTPTPSQEGNNSPLEGGQGGVPKVLSDIIMKLMSKTAE
ncbi:MAG: serine/threonine protein kinase, partial [bacterium]|nr:serine/threonine protein kinase [bacterium]